MIVLDTNVLSELARPIPSAQVLAWLASQVPGDLYVSAITKAELRFGIALLPPGRRRDGLAEALERLIDTEFGGRILPFDSSAADHYGEMSAARRGAGRPISVLDAQIAATVRCNGASLATRNVRDFELCDIKILDPWTATTR